MKKHIFFVKSSLGILFFVLVLFISAGRIDYYQGWIYLSMSVLGLLMNFFSIKGNMELMKERSKPGKGTKKWDQKLLGLLALLTLVMLVVAGLDSGRFIWSPQFQWYTYTLGIVLMFKGQLIFLIAKNQNTFFSSVARVQTERNHSVCDTGIYKLIRHPGYSGMIISMASFPLVTGSLFSIIPSFISIIILVLRTQLEDKMLQKELEGYVEYTKKTRYRLFPRIW